MTSCRGVAYYNEIDPFAAQWLRELIKAGMIAAGEVDERDIRDVRPGDIAGFTQCHFFAGIGVWSYALRQAGWPDDKPVWTGSCPCQPFSVAGKRKGTADDRHLWPDWFRLISQCSPSHVFGEQVASKDGIAWLDSVSADLERTAYTCGPVVLPACGVGAPHRRERLFFVAESDSERLNRKHALLLARGQDETGLEAARSGTTGLVAHTLSAGRATRRTKPGDRQIAGGRGACDLGDSGSIGSRGNTGSLPSAQGTRGSAGRENGRESNELELASEPSVVGNPYRQGRQGRQGERGDDGAELSTAQRTGGPVNGFWADAEWIYCRDEKYRATKPGIFPLAHGFAGRVGILRGAGNAINAEAAKEVIMAYMGHE